jgi:hypothetical protein
MDDRTQKPATDLERIQESYTSGSQSYISTENTPRVVKRSEELRDSARDFRCQTPSRD